MSGNDSKRAGVVLIAAAIVGVAVISIGPLVSLSHVAPKAGAAPNQEREIGRQPVHVATLNEVVDRVAPDSGAASLPAPREEVASPFSASGTDSATALCVEKVRQRFDSSTESSTGVEIDGHHGVRPPEHRGPDSLVVDGTGPGRDETRGVWHCAVTATPFGAVSRIVIAVEDGWPGVAPTFDAAHALSVKARDACLEETKKLLPEYVHRGVKFNRVADTLHVTGDAFPLDPGDLAEHFHCRAVVHGTAVVNVIARTGQ